MRMRAPGAFVVICAAVVAACQVIAGIERVGKVVEGADGSTSSSSSSSGGPNPNDPCKHVLAPVKPAQNDPGGDPDNQRFLAVKMLTLTDPTENGIGGLDLDGTCTCDTQKGTAHDGGAPCTPRRNSVTCDLDGGVDNAGLDALPDRLRGGPGRDEDRLSRRAFERRASRAAQRTIMLYIEELERSQERPRRASVGVFISNGTFLPDGDDAGTSEPRPFGTATTRGAIRAALHKEGLIVPNTTAAGYVTNGRLVVQNQDKVTILFGNAGFGLRRRDRHRRPREGRDERRRDVHRRHRRTHPARGSPRRGGADLGRQRHLVCNAQGGTHLLDCSSSPAICGSADIAASRRTPTSRTARATRSPPRSRSSPYRPKSAVTRSTPTPPKDRTPALRAGSRRPAVYRAPRN